MVSMIIRLHGTCLLLTSKAVDLKEKIVKVLAYRLDAMAKEIFSVPRHQVKPSIHLGPDYLRIPPSQIESILLKGSIFVNEKRVTKKSLDVGPFSSLFPCSPPVVRGRCAGEGGGSAGLCSASL